MAHAHAHGEVESTYFLDQLFTILAAGSVGVVAILMYQTGMLSRILVPMFFKPVLIGGLAILVMAVIRAIAVWQLAGARRQAEAAGHGHDHGHSHSHAAGHDDAHSHGDDCGHDHGHEEETCDHAHSHAHGHEHSHAAAVVDEDAGHAHGWAPWRYMVIAIPVFLYFLGLPREGFSELARDRQLVKGSLTDPNRRALSLLGGGPVMTKVLRKSQPETHDLTKTIEGKDGFTQLAEIAAMPVLHDRWDGDIAIVRGQYTPRPGSDREFTLVNWRMTCCRADAVVLEARIFAPDPVRIDNSRMVDVKGVISFQQSDRGKWVPVITLQSNEDIILSAE